MAGIMLVPLELWMRLALQDTCHIKHFREISIFGSEHPAWISYNFTDNKPRTVNGYRFYFCNGPDLTSRAPRHFELQAVLADNDMVWTTVDARRSETNWYRCEERTYRLTNEITSIHFRWVFNEMTEHRLWRLAYETFNSFRWMAGLPRECMVSSHCK